MSREPALTYLGMFVPILSPHHLTNGAAPFDALANPMISNATSMPPRDCANPFFPVFNSGIGPKRQTYANRRNGLSYFDTRTQQWLT